MEKMGLVVLERKDIVKANIIAGRIGDNFIAGYLLALGNELRKRMQQGVVEFFYHKKNGEVRRAFGTTMPALAKAHILHGGSSVSVITYWDCERNDWRSCQIQSLIKVC